MKKTGWLELFQTIKHTFVSFLAIVLFITCASALYVGIHWTINSLSLSLEKEYHDGNMYHFKVQSELGFTDEIIEELKNSDCIDGLEIFHETYRFFTFNGEPYQAKVISLTKEINNPLRIEGKLPEKAGEAAIDSHFAGQKGIKVGDRLSLLTNQYVNPVGLVDGNVTVTAIIDTAEYMGKYEDTNGFSFASYANVNTILYLSDDSFNKDVFNRYFGFYIKTDELNGMLTMSDEYNEKSAELTAKIKGLINSAAVEYLGMDEDVVDKLYVVTERNHNASLFGLKCVRDTFDKMQYSLVSLFIIISLLVCYSTLSRLVHDQSVLIGMKKAQGFSTSKILLPFVLYSELAAIIGITAGVFTGYFGIEPVTVNSTKQTFLFGDIIPYYNIRDVLFLIMLILVLIFATVCIACYRISSQKAYVLLSGEETENKKTYSWSEKLPIFRNLSTFTKSSIIGCFENKRRIFATIIGVIGSASLVISAFTMYLNLDKSFKLSFDDIINYDKTILFEQIDSKDDIETVLKNKGYSYTESLYTFGVTTLENGENIITTVYVVDDTDFYDFIRLRNVRDNTEKAAANGIWVNIGYAEHNEASEGNALRFTDALGTPHDFEIEGIYNYYLMNYQIIMTKSTFEKEFNGRKYEPNIFLIDTNRCDFEEFKSGLNDISGITSVNDYYQSQKNLFGGFLTIARAVAGVYLLLSVLLSVFILLNLYTMFVREKKREMITLMINGYDRKYIEKYFYVDTLILTVIGTIIGTIVGTLNGRVSLDSFNNNATHFYNEINVTACVIGILFSFALSFAMCKIALQKIKKFEYSDINTD